MENHDMSIASQLAIHLDHVDPGFDRLLESQLGIFWKIVRGTAMGYFDKGNHEPSRVGTTNFSKDLELFTGGLGILGEMHEELLILLRAKQR